ncbi:glycosyltransferase family 4 protein [Actinobaculum suis]|nr:glycosyltransferase family 4 protein [Actinobaculum suis]
MRIALVSDCFMPRLGGIESQVRDLALALQNNGHQVLVITATPAQRGGGYSHDVVEGIRVLRLATPIFGGIPINPFCGRQLLAALQGADVVHINTGLVSPFAWHALLLAKLHTLPALVTWHSVLKPTVWPYIPFVRPITGPTIRHAAPSQLVAREVKQVVGQKGEVAVIPNGVSLRDWRQVASWRLAARASEPASESASTSTPEPAPETAPEQAKLLREQRRLRIISARRLAPRKRTLEMLEIVKAAREISGLDATLTIYGEGPQRWELERWIRSHRAASWVRLPGRASRAELMQAYAQADIYLSSSRLESFGIATLEARAAGLPVVCPTNTGADDFLENEVSGLLGESDQDVAAQLARLLLDDELRGRITHHNATTEPRENWELVTRLTEVEYRAALRGTE